MNKKARDIADLQRIERGYFNDADKLKEFKTLKKDLSPIELEMFNARLEAKLIKQSKPPKPAKQDQKPPKKDKDKK